MREILKAPDSTAFWGWAGPNDVEDDVYFRKTVGTLPMTLVEPGGKVTTTWGALRLIDKTAFCRGGLLCHPFCIGSNPCVAPQGDLT